jgi:Stress responsive A/B Barrel Domain
VSGLRHVVMFGFRDGTTDEQITAMTRGLETLPGLIPEIAEYRVGPDAGINDGNQHYAVVADFGSVDDYLVYRDHPAHLAVIAEVIRPILESRAAVQYVI